MRLTIAGTLLVLLGSAAFGQEPGCLRSDEGKLTNHGCYLNADHQPTHRPSEASAQPVDASAHCADGSYSFSRHRSGTCSSHGGVAQRYR